MMVECPHCHRRVLPLANGECTACHENTTDANNGNSNETLLSITEATQYPDTCCICNEPTTNRVRVHHTGQLAGVTSPNQQSAGGKDWMPLFLFGLLGKLVFLFAHAINRTEPGKSSFSAHVPQCKSCAAAK